MRYLGLIILCILFVIGLATFYKLLDAVLLGAVLAYIVYPINLIFLRFTKSKDVSAALTVFLAVIPTVLILMYAFYVFAKEATALFSSMPLEEFRTILSDLLAKVRLEQLSTEIVQDIYNVVRPIIVTSFQRILQIPTIILKAFVMVASTFYFIRDGSKIKELIVNITPETMKDLVTDLFDAMDTVFHGMYIGYFLTSLLVGVFAGVGFYIMGVQYSLLLATITAIASLLPVIGPWLVYGPLFVIFFVKNKIFLAFVVLIYGVVFLSLIPDIYLRPNLAGRVARVHPLIILLGFIGGPMVFGIVGFVIGPGVLGLIKAVVDTYTERSM
ncbi:MAG: AI-2E family transporter [Candidatus Hydrothermarchaeota archaeon]